MSWYTHSEHVGVQRLCRCRKSVIMNTKTESIKQEPPSLQPHEAFEPDPVARGPHAAQNEHVRNEPDKPLLSLKAIPLRHMAPSSQ